MDDGFESRTRRDLREEASRLQPAPPDLDRVRADAQTVGRRSRVVGIAAAVVVLVALGTVVIVQTDQPATVVLDDGVAAPMPAVREELVGRRFVSTEPLQGAPAPGGVLTLDIDEPTDLEGAPADAIRLSGRTEPGCNGGGGVGPLADDGRVRLETVESTDMGCPGVREEMDDWWRAVLEGEPRLLAGGDRLVLVVDDAPIEMVEVPVPTPTPRPTPTQSIVPGGNCRAVAEVVANRLIDIVGAVDLEVFLAGGGDAVPDAQIDAFNDALDHGIEDAQCDVAPLLQWVTQDAYGLAIERFGDTEDAQARYSIMGYLLLSLFPEDVEPLIPTVPPTDPAHLPGSPGATDSTPTTSPTISVPPPQPVDIPTDDVWCGERGLIGALVTTDGALEAMCADGTTVAIDPTGDYRRVDAGRDAIAVGLRDPDGAPRITAFTLQGGSSPHPVDGSSLPALSPDGRLAWVGPDGSSVHVAPAGDAPGPSRQLETPVVDLSWDRSGRWLFVVTGDATNHTIQAWEVEGPDTQPLLRVPGDGVVAATGETDTPENVVALVLAGDGLSLQAAHVGQRLSGIAAVQDGLTAGALVEPLGLLGFRPDDGTWAHGTRIGWLVGVGDALWYVDGSTTALVRDGVRDVAILPR